MHKRARQRAAECTPLSASALHRVLRRTSVPTTKGRLNAFLIGCEVPLQQRPLWEQAAARARRNHRAATADAKQAMNHLEAQFADGSARLTPEKATHLLRAAGFDPAESYRGFSTPWTARCAACQAVHRIRLSDAVQGQSRCTTYPGQRLSEKAACEHDQRRPVPFLDLETWTATMVH